MGRDEIISVTIARVEGGELMFNGVKQPLPYQDYESRPDVLPPPASSVP